MGIDWGFEIEILAGCWKLLVVLRWSRKKQRASWKRASRSESKNSKQKPGKHLTQEWHWPKWKGNRSTSKRNCCSSRWNWVNQVVKWLNYSLIRTRKTKEWVVNSWSQEATLQHRTWIPENLSVDWKTEKRIRVHTTWTRQIQINLICRKSWPIQRLHWRIKQENWANEIRTWKFEERMG